MHGISIDDSPDAPVGTPALRRTIAIHWYWTTEHTIEEMADALGVTRQTVEKYLQSGPNQEVREMMSRVEEQVRMVAVQELREQLQAAGHRARTAEKPVEVWTDDDGNLRVKDERHPETGELTGKYPVPEDIELGPDEEARFYARSEVREILDQLTDLVGAGEPEKVEHEHNGIVIQTEAPEDGDGD